MKKKYGICIVEDHEVFRMGLRELICRQDDLYVCGETDNTDEAWKIMQKVKPDLAIIDLSLKDRSGLALIRDLQKFDKSIPVLVLSMFDETLHAERVFAAGARGYIMKQETSESIITAIRQILAGNIYASGRIVTSVLQRLSAGAAKGAESGMEGLTDRELEVFQLIGAGLTSAEIAKRLNLSVRTVGTYKEHIKRKLNLKSTSDLMKRAALWNGREESPGDPDSR
jgi:DNA-binding NarL/FixJ family response regulator